MTQDELRDFEELFATNGWRRLVADAEEALRQREQAALYAQSWDEVCFYRGEAAQLGVLVSLEAAVASTLEQEAE